MKLNAFAIYLQTQDDILSRLKPERATRPIPKRRPLYATATRPIPKRRRPLYATATRPILKRRPLYATATRPIPNRRPLYKADPEKKKASVRDSYKADPEKKKAARAVRDSYNPDIESKQSAKKQRYQEDLAENRAAKRRTIQLPLGHLKGIGIGMTPLSDWLNALPRGRGSAGVTELPLALKSYRKMCMQHVYSTHVRDLHKTIHFICKAMTAW